MDEVLDKYEPLFTIGVIARLLKVSVQVIRLYEKEGLILPYKTDSRRRFYSYHDLERLKCIRQMLGDKGLNLSGIRKIFALIPCWHYRGGLNEDCKTCPAYTQSNGPCWSLKNVGGKCTDTDCRQCNVYRMEFSCEKLKDIFYHGNQFKSSTN